MKIKSIFVQNFKRFTDLQIDNLSETAKLIMLIGSNGSGKSSLFEALNYWILPHKNVSAEFHREYHVKSDLLFPQRHLTEKFDFHKNILVTFFDINVRRPDPRDVVTIDEKKAFYIRTAYRYEPSFYIENLSNLPPIIDDKTHPIKMINIDKRVSENYQRLVGNLIQDLFDTSQNLSVSELRNKTLKQIRDAMLNIFDDLVLTSMGDPLTNGTFLFDKGASKNFPYVNLSGGEKATFDLLLDFIIKKQVFDDTVYCIDEPDLHMHTKVQGRLLGELYNQLPENCQLWIATHSIGMMRKAFELYQQNPDEVVFLDFDGHNFDEAVIIEPATVDRNLWKKVFSVALDDLADLVAPSEIVFCEGKTEQNRKHRNTTFDAEVYNIIFGQTRPDTQFVPFEDSNSIETYSRLVSSTFKHIFSANSAIKMWSVMDRDDMTPAEIEGQKEKNIRVLAYRHLESYLWDDEILRKLCDDLGQSTKYQDILAEKTNLISQLTAQNKPADDMKAITGYLHTQIKKILQLQQGGKTVEAFAKEFLAPLVTPDTKVYQQLEQDIFDT